MGNLVVEISDYKSSKNPDVIITYALGSCVGICLYDNQTKRGGMAHIMLPNSKEFKIQKINRMKFADTAIPDLVEKLKREGANITRLTAKIAGGAQMFALQKGSPLGVIGDRNIASTKHTLQAMRIPIVSEDTGKNYGRTLYFDLETGLVRVQSLNNTTNIL
ncbi:MAG: chemotaxis protein CheD [Eubacteriales bacterium]|nr:chemotaxis protein CheD [Eubacteriales bacterium]MDD4390107.1 chemotaxis protein CheD [Eubacteriales bacterium]